MSEIVRGRYAPSPSGDLHFGNLRTALLAWLFTRVTEGQFVMRIEDLDQPRMRPEASSRILDDLRWLGLDWDEGPDCGGPHAPYIQSERIPLYKHYLLQLQRMGLVYRCYCSRAEVAQAASAPQQGDGREGARYPGTCRHLTEQQQRQYEASGRRPSLRFRVDNERVVTFVDQLAGPVMEHVQQIVGDFIICRADGIFAYQFAVVIDDALMQINQVVRGADLLGSTARQILLYEALDFPAPTFAHVPLLLDESGQRLSKRSQSTGLAPLQAAGVHPQEVVAELAASCGLLPQRDAISPDKLARIYRQQGCAIMRAKLAV